MELTYPIDSLRRRFRGALLRRGEEGYDEARRVWSGAIDCYPALVARCAGADDVTAAVSFARERDRSVSVKGGGHAVAGHAIRDNGIVIDLSLMNRVEVDPRARAARARSDRSDLDRVTQTYGLATTGGIVSHRDRQTHPRWRAGPSHAGTASPSTTCSASTWSPPTGP
jgi:hypothetical protein